LGGFFDGNFFELDSAVIEGIILHDVIELELQAVNCGFVGINEPDKLE
jgi:hypothetical protein